MKLVDDPHEEKLLWEIRESGLGSTSKIPQLSDFTRMGGLGRPAQGRGAISARPVQVAR